MVTVYVEMDASNKFFRLAPLMFPCPLPYFSSLFINPLYSKPLLRYTKGHLQFRPPILVEFLQFMNWACDAISHTICIKPPWC